MRRFWLLGVGLTALAQKLKAQIQMTQVEFKQIRLLFNPAHFDSTDVNGVTQISLKIPSLFTPEQIRVTVTPGNNVATLPKDFEFGLVYLNGLFQTEGFDYTKSGTTLTFVTPRNVGDTLTVIRLK